MRKRTSILTKQVQRIDQSATVGTSIPTAPPQRSSSKRYYLTENLEHAVQLFGEAGRLSTHHTSTTAARPTTAPNPRSSFPQLPTVKRPDLQDALGDIIKSEGRETSAPAKNGKRKYEDTSEDENKDRDSRPTQRNRRRYGNR